MQSLARDLNALLSSRQVLWQREDLLAYANDATHYFKQVLPEAVVLPKTTEEVAKVVRYAFQREIPVTPRGAGSGLAGGCTPVKGGIVIDMKPMNKIIEIDRRDMTSRVEAGVVLARFHREVEKMGLFYPPDPQSMSVCTIGGNIATRAGGPRGVKYGTTSNYVLGLEVVLPDGEVITTGGKFVKQSVGYDLTHLMTGSEGTLGVITKATLRLLTLPPAHQTVVVACETLDGAAEMVSEMIARGIVPAMLEFLVALAVTVMNNYISPPLPVDAEAYLLMDLDGIQEEVELKTKAVQELCISMGAREVRVIEDPKEAASYWKARSNLYPLMLTLMKKVITEDVTVPRYRIPEFVRAVRETAASLGVSIGIAGHAGDGNMHPTILYTEVNEEAEKRGEEAIRQLIKRGLALGGTISGEHGIGIHKAEFVPWELGEVQINLMKRIKEAFDPKNIMNPGKIWPEGGEA